jgi:hypothetical protein
MGRDLSNRPPLCWGINNLKSLSSHHQGETEKPKFKGFRFESYWLAMLGFWEVVSQTWKKKPFMPQTQSGASTSNCPE